MRMSNCATIVTKKKDLEVYVHWNGGYASVKAFLDYCKAKGYRCPEEDPYGWARLCQVIGNFFGSSTSVGIEPYGMFESQARFDNGTYIIEKWKIIGREHVPIQEEWNYPKYEGMMREINEKMPVQERLTEAEIKEAINEGFLEVKTEVRQ